MKRKTRLTVGSYCLLRQKVDAKRWIDGDVASKYKPAWMVKLRLPGNVQKVASSAYAICEKCLAVPEDESPARVREKCGCLEPAHRFARDWLEREVTTWDEGRLANLNAWRQRKADLLCREVAECYKGNVPLSGRANYLRNLDRWFAIIEETTGRAADEQAVTVTTWNLFLDWAQMRQEFHRRGWSKRGGVPAEVKDPWAVLRADLKARRLPPIDKETVCAGNTTIKSYLNAARAVLGPTGRSEYLRGLEMPPLTDFMTGKVKLPSPRGHQEIEAGAYARMYEAAARLKGENLHLWVVNQMLWRFGCRPCEVPAARLGWIEHDKEGPMFVLKNRHEEDFRLKARERSIVRRLRIAPDLWAAMREVATEGSLIGAASMTAARNLVEREHNEWMRQFVPEGQHGNYLLRHWVATHVQDRWGTKMASLFLGHATSATLSGERMTITEDRYGDSAKACPALTWEDLAPVVTS